LYSRIIVIIAAAQRGPTAVRDVPPHGIRRIDSAGPILRTIDEEITAAQRQCEHLTIYAVIDATAVLASVEHRAPAHLALAHRMDRSDRVEDIVLPTDPVLLSLQTM
jgi:hypothetical protein